MTTKDIINEIDWYEKRIIEDPAGKNLYQAMIDSLKAELKVRERRKNARKKIR